jgi:flavin reductase (DIM6/NTAB) family NADH-FMN oxidoreductase RutF
VRDAFDELVARADAAMVIVTTAVGDERSGCLVGFHSQCGMNPPRYAVWISNANHTHAVAARATSFAVHLVPADRRDLAELFGGSSGDEVDKLGRCDWSPAIGGAPLLGGCPDRFVGRKVAWLDAVADHTCLVLEPAAAEIGSSGSLLRLHDVTDIDPGHEAED